MRYTILSMLFAVSAFSYGDRLTLSVVGAAMEGSLHLDALRMGYLFAGFSLAYVIGQLPAGRMLDRFGSRRVYGLSLVFSSACALLTGAAGYAPASIAFAVISSLRFLSGLAQSPVFPGNGRIVAAWFPDTERGIASAVFNSSQYFSLVLFAPALGWITHIFGWKASFWFMGLLGLGLSLMWLKTIYSVKDHPRLSPAELTCIERGGGLVNTDLRRDRGKKTGSPSILVALRALIGNRMLVGVYCGQYFITALAWFFLTWFPIYLKQAAHMSILKAGFFTAIPAFSGSIGGILGGVVSDRLLRDGHSLTLSRKIPIVVGMLLAVTVVTCNYFNGQWTLIFILSLAFFGKGFGALGWTVISDTSPIGMAGLNGGLFNFIGNLAGITTPITIGYLVKWTGSFHDALIYVSTMALMTIFSYVVIVGEIRRLEVPIML